MNRLVIYAVPALLLFGGLLILSRGRVFSFYNYLVYSAPYEGNTAITKSVVISTESDKSVFISNPDFQDFSRRSPDFDKPLKDQINAPHTAAELQRYGWLVGRVRDKSPGEVVRQVYAVHLALRHSGRKIDPGVIGAVLEPLHDPAVDMATLAAEITDPAERSDPNVVKAVVDLAPGARIGRALYFSRAAIPAGDGPLLHHIGLYAFRREALAQFVALPESPLERRERLEQLRALAAGMRIDVALVDTVPDGVDTPADLEKARSRLGHRE